MGTMYAQSLELHNPRLPIDITNHCASDICWNVSFYHYHYSLNFYATHFPRKITLGSLGVIKQIINYKYGKAQIFT